MTRKNVSETRPARVRRSLAALAVLGLLSALLAWFLWRQLLVARAGGTPVCGFGDEGSCGALWDSAFASAVHRLTGVPVAGWGLVWGVVASFLPLLALARLRGAGRLAGVRWVALGGLVATVVLAGVSVAQGIFCAGCAATYVLAFAYAAVALWGLGGGLPPRPAGPGLGWALGATLLAFLALLYPGLRTPQSASDSLGRAISQTGPASRAVTPAPETEPLDATPVPPESGAQPAPPALGEEPTGAEELKAERDRAIWDFVLQLEPQDQQVLADALYVYTHSPIIPSFEPRVVLGPAGAPIRLTAFTDVRCPACAELHKNLEVIERALPPGSFNFEPRQFPLDRRCNRLIQGERPELIRCQGAKALICLEGLDEPGALAQVQSQIFEAQERLDESLLYSLTDPHIDRTRLGRCMESAETAAKLEEDIRWAELHHIQGTPLVLLNGRQAPSFGPFLFVILLNQGSPDHPAFQQLPPASSRVTG